MPPDLEGVKVCFAGSSRSSSFDVAGGRGRRAIGRAASTPCPTRHPRQPDASVGARTRAKSVSSGHSGDPGWVTWCEWTGAVGASKWEGGGRGTPGTFEGGRLDEERANGDVLGGGRGRKRRASISASKRVRVHVGWIRKTGQRGRSGCEKVGGHVCAGMKSTKKGRKKQPSRCTTTHCWKAPKTPLRRFCMRDEEEVDGRRDLSRSLGRGWLDAPVRKIEAVRRESERSE